MALKNQSRVDVETRAYSRWGRTPRGQSRTRWALNGLQDRALVGHIPTTLFLTNASPGIVRAVSLGPVRFARLSGMRLCPRLPVRRAVAHVLLLSGVSLLWSMGAGAAAESDLDVARGARPAAGSRLYSLEECMRLAEANYPKIAESRARLHRMQAELSEAHTAPFSEWRVEAGVGVAPAIRGTSVFTPNTDVSLTSNVALAWKVGIDGVIPLWTFGKITNLWEAAEAGTEVGKHDIQKTKNEVRLAVQQAYYGLQFARDALALVHKAIEIIDGQMTAMEEDVRNGDAEEAALFKLKMYRAELDARESEALKQAADARAGLRFLVGVRGQIDIPDVPLRQVGHELAPLASYLSAAQLFRPEINMARAGIVARQAQVRLQQAGYYPDIGLGLRFDWIRGPEVTDQLNPFVRDQANAVGYGLGLVLRWKLDLLSDHARVMQAEAQLEEMRAVQAYALGGVGVEVERAFNEAQHARKRLGAYTQATDYAKRWLITVQQGIDIGAYEDEDLIEPAKEWALNRFQQMDATYKYNVAMAQLALATGWDAISVGR